MKTTTVIANARDCFVEVTHHDGDPNSWIVNRWKGMILFRKRVSSNWFIDKQQAFAYADELKREHEVRPGGFR